MRPLDMVKLVQSVKLLSLLDYVIGANKLNLKCLLTWVEFDLKNILELGVELQRELTLL